MSSASRSRNWCFTVNNPNEDDDMNLVRMQNVCRFYIIGNEVGESKTPHWQGFVMFQHAKTLSAVRRYLPGAHFELARGTPMANIEYCSKDGDVDIYGDMPMDAYEMGRQGKEYWDNVLDMTKQGKMWELDSRIIVTHYNTLCKITKDCMKKPPNLDSPCGWWFYGVPGAGKSFTARDEFPNAYWKDARTRWWDGYQGEEFVIIDELSPCDRPLAASLKIWMDSYAFIAEIKGGALAIRPKAVVVTSNYSICDVFGDGIDARAIERRCAGHVRYFDKTYEERLKGETEYVEADKVSYESEEIDLTNIEY